MCHYRHFKVFVYLLVAGTLWGCDAASVESTPDIAQTGDVAQAGADLRVLYSDQLSYINSKADGSEAFFGDRNAMLQATVDFYGARFGQTSDVYLGVLSAAESARTSTSAARTGANELPEHMRAVAGQVDAAIDGSASYEEFQNALSSIEAAIIVGEGSEVERVDKLSYVVVLSETMSFMDENGLLVPHENARGINWRCIGGVASGAVLGGFTGAGRGAVIPLGPYSITAGAVVGAIAGGVAGGISAC